jgi:hypothetical protein
MQERQSADIQHQCQEALARCAQSLAKAENVSTAGYCYSKVTQSLEFIQNCGGDNQKVAELDARLSAIKHAPDVLAAQQSSVLCPHWFVEQEKRSKIARMQ